jgi:hypothetical protein
MDVSRDEVKQMVIELTLGVAKEDSSYASLSDRHSKRRDQIEVEFNRATSNVDAPDAFDPARTAAQPGQA